MNNSDLIPLFIVPSFILYARTQPATIMLVTLQMPKDENVLYLLYWTMATEAWEWWSFQQHHISGVLSVHCLSPNTTEKPSVNVTRVCQTLFFVACCLCLCSRVWGCWTQSIQRDIQHRVERRKNGKNHCKDVRFVLRWFLVLYVYGILYYKCAFLRELCNVTIDFVRMPSLPDDMQIEVERRKNEKTTTTPKKEDDTTMLQWRQQRNDFNNWKWKNLKTWIIALNVLPLNCSIITEIVSSVV